MRTEFEREDVKVTVLHNANHEAERIEAVVGNGVHQVVIRRAMRHGRLHWEIKGGAPGLEDGSFEDAWAAIPIWLEKDGRRYDVAKIVAEVVDATGRVTPTGDAFSSASGEVERAIDDFKRRFLPAKTIQLLRRLLAAEGYSVTPDRDLIKKLGSGAQNSAAYHEIAGTLVDRLFDKEPLDALELMKMSADWANFKDWLDE